MIFPKIVSSPAQEDGCERRCASRGLADAKIIPSAICVVFMDDTEERSVKY